MEDNQNPEEEAFAATQTMANGKHNIENTLRILCPLIPKVHVYREDLIEKMEWLNSERRKKKKRIIASKLERMVKDCNNGKSIKFSRIKHVSSDSGTDIDDVAYLKCKFCDQEFMSLKHFTCHTYACPVLEAFYTKCSVPVRRVDELPYMKRKYSNAFENLPKGARFHRKCRKNIVYCETDEEIDEELDNEREDKTYSVEEEDMVKDQDNEDIEVKNPGNESGENIQSDIGVTVLNNGGLKLYLNHSLIKNPIKVPRNILPSSEANISIFSNKNMNNVQVSNHNVSAQYANEEIIKKIKSNFSKIPVSKFSTIPSLTTALNGYTLPGLGISNPIDLKAFATNNKSMMNGSMHISKSNPRILKLVTSKSGLSGTAGPANFTTVRKFLKIAPLNNSQSQSTLTTSNLNAVQGDVRCYSNLSKYRPSYNVSNSGTGFQVVNSNSNFTTTSPLPTILNSQFRIAPTTVVPSITTPQFSLSNHMPSQLGYSTIPNLQSNVGNVFQPNHQQISNNSNQSVYISYPRVETNANYQTNVNCQFNLTVKQDSFHPVNVSAPMESQFYIPPVPDDHQYIQTVNNMNNVNPPFGTQTTQMQFLSTPSVNLGLDGELLSINQNIQQNLGYSSNANEIEVEQVVRPLIRVKKLSELM